MLLDSIEVGPREWLSSNGHLEVLKWAREGCLWDEETCSKAAIYNKFVLNVITILTTRV